MVLPERFRFCSRVETSSQISVSFSFKGMIDVKFSRKVRSAPIDFGKRFGTTAELLIPRAN